jgi:hypothetical protein
MKAADFKMLKDVEELPPDMTKEDYVAVKVRETFTPPAMQEIRKGFWSLTSIDFFKQVSAADLQQIICPIDHLNTGIDIRHIFKVVIEEEMTECKLFINAFWAVVDGFTLEEKKLFLRFVTGLEAPPEPGTERLMIELPFSAFSKDEHTAMLDMLPQAHTCTNTLELPNYHDALKESGKFTDDSGGDASFAKQLQKLLSEKLRMAIRETGSYELDAVAEVTGNSHQPLQRTRSPPAAHEDKGNPSGDFIKGVFPDLPRASSPGTSSVGEIPDPNEDSGCVPIHGDGSDSASLQSLRPGTGISAYSQGIAPSRQHTLDRYVSSEIVEPRRLDGTPQPSDFAGSGQEAFSSMPPAALQEQLQPLRPLGKDLESLRPLEAPYASGDMDSQTTSASIEPHGRVPEDAAWPQKPMRNALEPLKAVPAAPCEGGIEQSAGSDLEGLLNQGVFKSLLQPSPAKETISASGGKVNASIDDLIEELDMMDIGK